MAKFSLSPSVQNDPEYVLARPLFGYIALSVLYSQRRNDGDTYFSSGASRRDNTLSSAAIVPAQHIRGELKYVVWPDSFYV